MKHRFFKLFLLWMTALTFVACSSNTQKEKQEGTNTTTTQVEQSQNLPDSLLPFKREKQLVLGELDSYKRSTQAHIQLRYDDKPTEQRESKINVDPVGWHNFKFPVDYSGKEAWFMNRGHLVGYQFSGLNDELRNLTTMTAYLNTGSMTGTDEKNPVAMLFYEENGILDYQTGMAEATLQSEKQEKTQPESKNKNDRTVYVANEGKATVYWYDKKRMPAKTNQAKVVEMTESQAKAQGKTHAGKE